MGVKCFIMDWCDSNATTLFNYTLDRNNLFIHCKHGPLWIEPSAVRAMLSGHCLINISPFTVYNLQKVMFDWLCKVLGAKSGQLLDILAQQMLILGLRLIIRGYIKMFRAWIWDTVSLSRSNMTRENDKKVDTLMNTFPFLEDSSHCCKRDIG